MINKVYIVLLSYNGSLDTMECLESVLKLNYVNCQIIVVDNSETLAPYENLINWALGNFNVIETLFQELVFPIEQKPVDFCTISEDNFLDRALNNKIIFVKANSNNGFAAGNNIALEYIFKFGMIDDYIWLLNNDTVVEKNALSEIVLKINETGNDANKLIFGTPLLEYYYPTIIQSIGGIYNKITGMTSHVGECTTIEGCDYEFEANNKIDYPIGASMLINISFLKEIGLLSEDYFLFYEELDWAYRAKAIGGGIRIIDYFGVYHKQGNSTKTKKKEKKSEFIDLLSLKNRIVFAQKFNQKNINLVYISIFTFTVGKRILQGNFKIIPKIFKLIFNK